MQIEGQQNQTPSSNAHLTNPSNQNPGGGNGGGAGDADDDSWFSDPTKVKDYVYKLRNENKTRRKEHQDLTTKLNQLQTQHQSVMQRLQQVFGQGDGSPDDLSKLPPEQQIEVLHQSIAQRDEALAEREAEIEFLNVSASLGIVEKRDRKYFKFLVSEFMEDKEEGYEMSDEDLSAIAEQVKQSQPRSSGNPSATSFANRIAPPDSQSNGQVTLEEFKNMGTLAKSQLYGQNPELYNALMKQSLGRS
jgi:hypothetical protein